MCLSTTGFLSDAMPCRQSQRARVSRKLKPMTGPDLWLMGNPRAEAAGVEVEVEWEGCLEVAEAEVVVVAEGWVV